MAHKITFMQVDRWNYQIQQWIQTGDVRALFDSDKIAYFYEQYKHVLKAIEEKATELNDEYLMKDDTGQILTEVVDGHKRLMFKSPEAEKEYTEKYKCFINSPIPPKPNLIVAK